MSSVRWEVLGVRWGGGGGGGVQVRQDSAEQKVPCRVRPT